MSAPKNSDLKKFALCRGFTEEALLTAAYYGFKKHVVVEHGKASSGLDIGRTLIGMHIKEVAVPVHLKQKFIGKDYVTAAYSRPKLIGGERTHYTTED